MEKKRSVGVTIFGWCEIIIGAIGTLFFATTLLVLLSVLQKGGEEMMGVTAAIVMLFFTVPSPLLLLAGIGILKLKSWGRKINLIGVPVSVLLLITFLLVGEIQRINSYVKYKPGISPFSNSGTIYLSIVISFLLFFTSLIVYYFTRSKVKEQFK